MAARVLGHAIHRRHNHQLRSESPAKGCHCAGLVSSLAGAAAQRLSEILAVLIEDRRGSWSCQSGVGAALLCSMASMARFIFGSGQVFAISCGVQLAYVRRAREHRQASLLAVTTIGSSEWGFRASLALGSDLPALP
ncbi:uncharacterized protein TrAtP1_004979 [Trichoderma atroviride]|uniref:uncharacterized protein n=1 Tax=Hypocrea atroviridis TaxID=63577 RepID=UPI00332C1A68|nr:hypothetical protein TrAtP1_004979 [Trichoderma atroviride]